MKRGILIIPLVLGACAPPTANTIYDQLGRQVTIVDTGVDQAGGPRVTAIGQFDNYNRYHVLTAGSGPGVVQTTLPAVFEAGGFVGGMAVLRPPRVNTSVSQTGGGATIAPGAATATGGAGGAGGNAAANATGGASSSTSSSTTGPVSSSSLFN